MSQENVELARLLFEAFRTAPETVGYDAAIDLLDDAPLDPEVEWDPRAVAKTFGVPDIDQIYVGIEGGKAFWREWLSGWETVTVDYELVDAGDQVVALVDQRMKGRSTGIDVKLGRYAQVFAFREGLLTHWKCYAKPEDALKAAGLSE
ncbi:MAG: nuclear transport factor 2 family protein [Solirubrobacterales bacterium]|nr:nuclear transport factor 2 family protein [Solirubrobacterales bacterium]